MFIELCNVRGGLFELVDLGFQCLVLGFIHFQLFKAISVCTLEFGGHSLDMGNQDCFSSIVIVLWANIHPILVSSGRRKRKTIRSLATSTPASAQASS